ncbi:hypothetical protein CVCC1112_4243 [Paenarthrobacter nicotinovorans]|uniref:hypothetical protein n=1 Tax=Paenarthrobacter nicotinovorans TaxID=29320 RepID=UPI0007CD2D1F|nr:hypothetical protein [Paenarthrobacter nicotinovorans]GAT89584.1 hypothetical protein CVCC1112_4243 [Paenarthrobacter nicotinovorans]
MRHDIGQALNLYSDTVTYQPIAGTDHGTLTIALHADRQPTSWDLWNDVTEQLDGDPFTASLMVDRAITRRLQERTESSALITSDAQQIQLHVPLPLDPTNAARSASDSGKLAPHQEALLPALRSAIRDVAPQELRAQADTIAAHAAAQIPSQAEVTAAFQRTTVADAVREFTNNSQQLQLRQEPAESATTTTLRDPLKTLRQSFPAHPSAALTPSAEAAQASTSNTHPTAHRQAGHER